MKILPRPLLALVFAVVLVPCSGWADAKADAIDREASAIASDLMSPYCPGRTVASCTSPAAAELREEIRASLERGESSGSIVAEMERRYGPDVLGRPKAAWGWVVPWAVPVLGVGVLLFWVARNAGRSTAQQPAAPARAEGDAAEMEARLDRELEALR